MAFCNNCGAQLAEGAKFCPKCGTATGAAAAPVNPQPETVATPQTEQPVQPTQPQAAPEPQPTWQEQKREMRDNAEKNIAAGLINEMNNTADTTAEYDPKDIEANKVMALLSYLGILVLIPIFGAKGSKFARFHANQGLILCIAAIAYSVVVNILMSILLAISWRLAAVSSILSLVSVAFLVWAVIGIINALNGKAKELPFIGKYRLLK